MWLVVVLCCDSDAKLMVARWSLVSLLLRQFALPDEKHSVLVTAAEFNLVCFRNY
jgi:hypothetical protein